MLRPAIFSALLAFSASAGAQGFDYDFFQVGYQRVTLEQGGFDVDGDGFGIDASFEITEQFFLTANYAIAEFEEQGVEVDLDNLSAGIGWHTPLSNQLDFVANLSYEYIELSALGQSADESGFGLGAGLRYQATDALELNGGIGHVDYGDGDDTTLNLRVLYGITDNIDVSVSGEWGDDSSALGLSGRFYFGAN